MTIEASLDIDPPVSVAGRYLLGDLLGVGGVARVYRARDLLLDRDVAVKLFEPGGDPGAPDKELAEMRTLAQLSHPNLVTVHDAGIGTGAVRGADLDAPCAYLVMALVDGLTLAECLRTEAMAPHRVWQVARDIAQALAYVHSRGVVHRDVKPANILLDRAGRAVLADFGISQSIGASAVTRSGETAGTAAFLSPEQVRGHNVSPAADVYAFGLVLLEALTGEREYRGTSVETALARLTRTPQITGRVPARWEDLLRAMTDTDPERRPSAREITTILDFELTDDDPVTAAERGRLPSAPSCSRSVVSRLARRTSRP